MLPDSMARSPAIDKCQKMKRERSFRPPARPHEPGEVRLLAHELTSIGGPPALPWWQQQFDIYGSPSTTRLSVCQRACTLGVLGWVGIEECAIVVGCLDLPKPEIDTPVRTRMHTGFCCSLAACTWGRVSDPNSRFERLTN
jgi:hypothetical protein